MNRTQQLARVGLFDAMVPRYTSYPTVPNFETAVGPDDVARWQAGLQPGTRLSLYLHIPFCERLCWFCACRTQGVRRPEAIAGYVDRLCEEIQRTAQALGPGLQVTRIHFGGGTPTILTPAQILRLGAEIRGAFDVVETAELAAEIDPTACDRARIDALKSIGMTRASIGIQDFDPEVQSAIGRIQSVEDTAAVVADLRAAGIESLNTDLVYGLPLQTPARLAATVAALIDLNPDRVALYGYAHVPWAARRQRLINPDDLPSARARLILVERAETLLADAGYRALGIDHFARPDDTLASAAADGRLRRNFQGYTDDDAEALIGFGPGAVSRYPGGYAQNTGATAAYAGRIAEGASAVSKGYALGLEDQVRATFIERLLCDLAVDLPALERQFGSFAGIVQTDIEHALDAFAPWLRVDDAGRLVLSTEGKPLARLIASTFDTFLPGSDGRHSRAI